MPNLTQHYLPIIARETKKVLGLYNLGTNVTFDGTETTYSLRAGDIAVEVWTPTPSLIRKVNPAFMAAVWEHAEVFIKAYQGFGEFVPLKDVLPASSIGSSSGLANYVQEYLGPVLAGLSESFGVGVANLVPVNTTTSLISGTVSSGNTLTASDGVWLNTPLSYTYQWFRNTQPIEGAVEASYAIPTEDIGANLYCTVWALNALGTSQPCNSNTVMPLA